MYLCLLQIYWLTWVWFCHWFYTFFFTSQRLHIHNHYLSSNECIITQLTVWTRKFVWWRCLIKILIYEGWNFFWQNLIWISLCKRQIKWAILSDFFLPSAPENMAKKQIIRKRMPRNWINTFEEFPITEIVWNTKMVKQVPFVWELYFWGELKRLNF